MRTTNYLLAIIAFLLFLHLVKSPNEDLLSKASAQTIKLSSSNKDTVLVKIVGVGNISGALPVIYGSSSLGYVLPVSNSPIILSKEAKLLPVKLAN